MIPGFLPLPQRGAESTVDPGKCKLSPWGCLVPSTVGTPARPSESARRRCPWPGQRKERGAHQSSLNPFSPQELVFPNQPLSGIAVMLREASAHQLPLPGSPPQLVQSPGGETGGGGWGCTGPLVSPSLTPRREGKCLTQDHTAVRSRVGTEAGFSCPWMLLTAHAWLPPAIRHPLWEPGRAACPERGCLRVHSPFLMKPCSDSLFHQVERSARCLSESPGS